MLSAFSSLSLASRPPALSLEKQSRVNTERGASASRQPTHPHDTPRGQFEERWRPSSEARRPPLPPLPLAQSRRLSKSPPPPRRHRHSRTSTTLPAPLGLQLRPLMLFSQGRSRLSSPSSPSRPRPRPRRHQRSNILILPHWPLNLQHHHDSSSNSKRKMHSRQPHLGKVHHHRLRGNRQ